MASCKNNACISLSLYGYRAAILDHVVQLPAIIREVGRTRMMCPRSSMDHRREPAVVIDAAIAMAFVVLRLVAAGRVAAGEGVLHACMLTPAIGTCS